MSDYDPTEYIEPIDPMQEPVPVPEPVQVPTQPDSTEVDWPDWTPDQPLAGMTPPAWTEPADYKPTYWEDPREIARWRYELDKPGAEVPGWVDPAQVHDAWDYFSAVNDGKPWWMWDYLSSDDPAREYLKTFKTEPVADETEPSTDINANFETGGLDQERYDALPTWAKAAYQILSKPERVGAATGALFGAAGGPAGIALGAGIGAGLAKAAEKYPQLSDWLMVLDIPAEAIERSIGTAWLGWSAGVEGWKREGIAGWADEAKNILSNLDAAWSASHMFYESIPEPVFGGMNAVGMDLEQTTLTPEQTASGAMKDAFDRINAGEQPEQVYRDLSERFGLGGQLREILGHGILDPLNVIPAFAAGIVPDVAKIIGKGNEPLVKAATLSSGPVDLVKNYGAILRTTQTPEQLSKAGWFSRYLAKVDEAGQWKTLKQTQGKTGNVLRDGWNYLNDLTPKAKAQEVLEAGREGLQMIVRGLDPAERVRIIHALENTPQDLARELSMEYIGSAEGAALPAMLKDFSPTANTLLDVWNGTAQQRQALNHLASVLDMSESRVLAELSKADDAQTLLRMYTERISKIDTDEARSILADIQEGRLQAGNLNELVKVFVTDSPAPFTKELFDAQFDAAMIEHTAKWATKWFGVEPDPVMIRLGQTVKNAQSLALLGLNPSYLENNAINNIVTMTVDGVFGMRSQDEIVKTWTRFGLSPERLNTGSGPGMIEADIGAAKTKPVDTSGVATVEGTIEQARAKAAKILQEASAKPGGLTDLNRSMKSASEKFGVFSNLSAKLEEWSSKQAMTAAMNQYMAQMHRPGKGFDPLPSDLARDLGPLAQVIEDAKRSSWSFEEISKKIFDDDILRRPVDSFIPDIANKIGKTEGDVREALMQSGAYDYLKDNIKPNMSAARTRKVFEGLVERVETELDSQNRAQIVDRAHAVAARVEVEGWHAAIDILDEIEQGRTGLWFQHFDDWEQTFAQVENLPRHVKTVVIENQRKNASRRWARQWENEAASYKGIADAIGLEGPEAQRFVTSYGNIGDGWKSFFETTDRLYREYFATKFKSDEAASRAWRKLQDDLDGFYADHAEYENRLQTEMDDIFAAMFERQFPGLATGAAEWRQGVRDIRMAMITEMRDWRTKVRDIHPNDRRLAWTSFLERDYKPRIIERMKANIDGAKRLWEIAQGREPAPVPSVQALPPVAPAEVITAETIRFPSYARTNTDKIRWIAKENGIYSDRHVLNTVNKYAGKDYKRVSDVTIEDAFTAFQKRSGVDLANETAEQAQAHVIEWNETVGTQPEPSGTTTPAIASPLGAMDSLDVSGPQTAAQVETWVHNIMPVLRELEIGMTGKDANYPASIKGSNLSPDIVQRLRAHIGQWDGQVRTEKLAGLRIAEMRRDAALINYTRRYGWDNLAMTVFPYELWSTRSMLQWAMRSIDKPAVFANYARIRDMQRETVERPGFPSRLADKIQIPVPFLPEWAGGSIFVDPLRQLFPFEQFASPIEQMSEDMNSQNKRAYYILQDWAGEEKISNTELQQALNSRSGALWEKALAQAKTEYDAEISNPWEFISTLQGPSLPISWAYSALKGDVNGISPLPVTSFVRSTTALLGVNKGRGVNLEGPMRKALGMPEQGEYWDFYIGRMLANMAADGTISAEDAQRAIVDKSGEIYDNAARMVSQTEALRYFSRPVSLDIFPQGEQELRALQDDFSRAIETRDNGTNPNAVTEFFDAHPEYSARLSAMKWDDPEDQLQNYLVGEVWDRYMSLPDLQKREVRKQFGTLFQDNFLNKETRNTDDIDPNTLASWAQAMGGYAPKTTQPVQLGVEFASEEDATAYQGYVDEKNKLFPGISELWNVYNGIPEDQRDLGMFPRLQEYLNWQNTYLADNPSIIPYAVSEDSEIAGADIGTQQAYYQYQAMKAEQFPSLSRSWNEYFSLEKGSQARKQYWNSHPELGNAIDFENAFVSQHPELLQYIKSDAWIVERIMGEDYQKPPTIDPQTFDGALVDQLLGYFYSNQPLSEGAEGMLRSMWKRDGNGVSYQDYLNYWLRMSFRN